VEYFKTHHDGVTDEDYEYVIVYGGSCVVFVCCECGLPVVTVNGVCPEHWDIPYDAPVSANDAMNDHYHIYHEDYDSHGHSHSVIRP